MQGKCVILTNYKILGYRGLSLQYSCHIHHLKDVSYIHHVHHLNDSTRKSCALLPLKNIYGLGNVHVYRMCHVCAEMLGLNFDHITRHSLASGFTWKFLPVRRLLSLFYNKFCLNYTSSAFTFFWFRFYLPMISINHSNGQNEMGGGVHIRFVVLIVTWKADVEASCHRPLQTIRFQFWRSFIWNKHLFVKIMSNMKLPKKVWIFICWPPQDPECAWACSQVSWKKIILILRQLHVLLVLVQGHKSYFMLPWPASQICFGPQMFGDIIYWALGLCGGDLQHVGCMAVRFMTYININAFFPVHMVGVSLYTVTLTHQNLFLQIKTNRNTCLEHIH